MVLQQLYYTSFRNTATNQTGYQIKAQTPGIASTSIDLLHKVMGYRVPPRMTNDPAATHPIALRYALASPREGVLVCTRSAGVDEYERPGNYFAHALVGPAHELADLIPPIAHWGNQFWVGQDALERGELPPIAIEQLHEACRFDYDAVWSFIHQPQHLDWFRSLMGAVLDFHQSGRKIVILDTQDNIALWIYAVTLALPTQYRPLLTFATYHHDPYSAPYCITGTTTDSNFHFSRDEYVSFFVLNAETQQVSTSAASDYVTYVCDRFTDRLYESDVMDFFDWMAQRDAAATVIPRALDDFVNFYQATLKMSLPMTSPKALAGARAVSEDVAHSTQPTQQDIDDLSVAAEVIGNQLAASGTLDLLDDYINTLIQLKRIDPAMSETVLKPSHILASFLPRGLEGGARELFAKLTQVYSADILKSTFNRPDFLSHIRQQLQPITLKGASAFWGLVGSSLTFDPPTHAILRDILMQTFTVFKAADEHALAVPAEVRVIINGLLKSSGEFFREILNSAYQFKTQKPESPALEWLYYAAVEPLPLKQRSASYWRLWGDMPQAALAKYELWRDLVNAKDTSTAFQKFSEWLTILQSSPEWQKYIVDEGLDILWKKADTDKHLLAGLVLLSDMAEPHLTAEYLERLVQVRLTHSRITLPDATTRALYERLQQGPYPLTPPQQAIIEGSLALMYKKLPDTAEQLETLRRHFDAVDTEVYQEEAGEFFKTFFAAKPVEKEHFNLLRASYILKHREAFWMLYWKHFQTLLLEEHRTEDSVRILHFWFKNFSHLAEFPYIVPEFFTELLAALEEIRASKQYNQIGKELENLLSRHDWSPIVNKVLVKARKGGLLGGLFER